MKTPRSKTARTALAAALCSTVATACTPVYSEPVCDAAGGRMDASGYCVIRDDLGGSPREYSNRAFDFRAAGIPIRFVGVIGSSATVYMSVPGSCNEPGTVWVFHGRGDSEDPMEYFADFTLTIHYQPPIREWFDELVATEFSGPHSFAELTAFEMRDMGVLEVCG